MAIVKSFETPFKILANYHRLLKVEINSNNQLLELLVAVYVSEEAKNSGGDPLWHEYVRIPFNQLNFDPRDIFYPLLENWQHSYLEGGSPSLQPGVTPHPPVLEPLNIPGP